MKRLILGVAAAAIASSQAMAGGRLDTFDFRGTSSLPGFEDVDVVGIFWDTRCSDVYYVADDIPAVGAGGAPIPATVWAPEMQASFLSWNNIPTSYIKMQVADILTLGNGNRRFDFINELTFETPVGSGFLASSPSTSLEQDATFVTGDDIDGDGDSDVFDPAAAGRNTCYDHDSDGDIEFPAGFYKAGTILDNDVQFNNRLVTSNIFWEVTPTSTPLGPGPTFPIIGPRLTDIQSVAVHEFGHSHGLAHSFINQISRTDGTGATMYPFIDIDDRFSEAAQRTLHDDDIAWSSYIYPEGSATSGPGALQPGDAAFTSVYRLISGSYTSGVTGLGVLGGNIWAQDAKTGRISVSGYSGKARLFFGDPDGPGPEPLGLYVFDPNSVINGDYVIPVRSGAWQLGMQALDGDPASTGNISLTAIIGGILGQHTYAEEFRSATATETNLEKNAGSREAVAVKTANVSGKNVITNKDVVLRNAGAITNIGTGAVFGATDVIYAERFTNAAVLAQLNAGATLTTGLYRTGVFDASVVPVFKRAGLFFGRANSDGTATIDLLNPVIAQTNFLAQDSDLAPHFYESKNVSGVVKTALSADPTLDVFLVLEALNSPILNDDPRPPLLGLQAVAANLNGKSYLSLNGGAFTLQQTRNWITELRFTPLN